MTPTPLFRLEGVIHRYDRAWTLRIDSLEIPAGGVFAIVGPNGSGKSTLLKLLHLLEPPQRGQISYRGHAVRHPAPLAFRREIAMVFQRPVMLWGNVRRNIEYGLRLRGMSEPEWVEEVLGVMNLRSLAEAPARTLSGGEMQRVALGRALAVRPQVLLLDEPTANLDPQSAAAIEAIIRTTSASPERTVVLVTHNIFQARRLAQHVAMILEGQLVEAAPVEAFFENPADGRTRAFVQGELIY